MNDHNKYSDEYISAYIDGELDNDERARLLFAEQQNAKLAKRICEARILKEKVQLAFSDVADTKEPKQSFNCIAFAKYHRALAASLLLFTAVSSLFLYNLNSDVSLIIAQQLITSTQPISAQRISKAVGDNKHVVINIAQYHPEQFSETVNHIEALLQQHKEDKTFRVEIVANKQGLKSLDTETSIHAARIYQLTQQFDNLKVVACAKSLAKLAAEGDPIQLMTSIMITPSAAQQIARRTEQGWLYLKI